MGKKTKYLSGDRAFATSSHDSEADGSDAADRDPKTGAGPESTADLGRFILQTAVILLAGLWIYSPAYHGDWLWDDDQLLTANPTVQSGSFQGLAKLWFNPDGADYFPLSYTALWAQWPFFGPNSTGYHVTTILLHITAALLLWALLAKMRIPGAWLSGVLFAIHPICVESVAWVSETKNTLSLPLFLLSCFFWVSQDDETESAKKLRLYVWSVIFFLLAMFAKTSVVALPVITLLYAWWKRGRISRQDLLLALPMFAISIVLGIVTIYYQHGRAIGQETILVGGAASRIATAGMAILFYLWKSVWPFDLLPIYPRWEVDPPKAWQFLPWPMILAAAWWIWTNRAGWGRHAAFALGFFLLTIAPVLGFITISYMRITWVADHFLYLPMIGVIALLSAGIMTWFKTTTTAEQRAAMVTGAVMIAVLSYASFRYAHAWANEDALWTHTLKTNHDAWQAHNRLGAKKFARGDVEGAHYHFQNSTRLRPDLGETHNNLGTTLSAKGQLNEAIKEFTEAARVTPHVPAIRVNLANSLAAASRFGEASDQYKILLQAEPNNPALLNNLGVTLYKLGKKEEAITEFRKALAIAPNLKDARESLAVALGEKPDPSAATPQANQSKPVPPLELNAPASPTLGPAVLP